MRTPGCVQGGRRGAETWSGTGNLIYEVYDSGNRDTDVSSCSKRNSPPLRVSFDGNPSAHPWAGLSLLKDVAREHPTRAAEGRPSSVATPGLGEVEGQVPGEGGMAHTGIEFSIPVAEAGMA